jgi:sec-independent protein translocase protein TatC
LHGEKLVYLNPAGGFNFVLLISIYTGLALTIPILIQQLYGFLKPILPKRAQYYAGRLFVFSLLLLVAGVAFGYYLAIPGALHFLYSFASDYVTASLTADSYLNFVIAYTIGLGIVFQLPLLVLFFHWIKPLTPSGLLKSERWVILFSFIAAAIITPTPDPLNQTVIALPVVAVYQLGAIMVLVAIARQRKRNRQAARLRQFAPIAKQPVAQSQPLAAPKVAPVQPKQYRSVDGFVVPAPRHAFYRPSPAPVRSFSTSTVSNRPSYVGNLQRPRSIDGFVLST